MAKKYYSSALLLMLFAGPSKAEETINIEALNPRPNLFIEESTRTIALELGDKIEDSFNLKNEQFDARIAGWRTTLQNGFRNGFRGYLKIAPDAKTADLVIRFVKLELSCDMPSGFRLVYQAKMSDSKGNPVGFSARTVDSKLLLLQNPQMALPAELYRMLAPDIVRTIVEPMYETLAKDLFGEMK